MIMKYFLFLLIASAAALVSCAQNKGSAKLYGFKEAVVSGVKTGVTEEGGETSQQAAKSGLNYFIYLQTPGRVYPSEIWIDGTVYSVTTETQATPVERQAFAAPSQSGKVQLVPKTSDKVVQLTPVNATPEKLSQKGKSLAESNELVVVYKQGGQFYYSVLKELKQLEPVALQ